MCLEKRACEKHWGINGGNIFERHGCECQTICSPSAELLSGGKLCTEVARDMKVAFGLKATLEWNPSPLLAKAKFCE